MSAALTNRQKRYLAQLARRALAAASGAVAKCGCPVDNATAWRHCQVIKATGRHGLRCCTQDDYGPLKAHFLNLLGEPGQALRADLRQLTNPMRVILWKIRRRCQDYGIGLDKAEGICRQMTHGLSLHQVETEATLWNIYFKLRYYEPKAEKLKS